MSGKVNFGRDFLYITRELQIRASEAGVIDPVSDAAAKLFLVQWGLSPDDVDEADTLFWDQASAGTLDEFHVAFERIVDYLGKDRAAQERLVIQLAALGSMDFAITDEEASFVRWFQDAFDLRPSEFNELCQRGWEWAIALAFYGDAYEQAKANQ